MFLVLKRQPLRSQRSNRLLVVLARKCPKPYELPFVLAGAVSSCYLPFTCSLARNAIPHIPPLHLLVLVFISPTVVGNCTTSRICFHQCNGSNTFFCILSSYLNYRTTVRFALQQVKHIVFGTVRLL